MYGGDLHAGVRGGGGETFVPSDTPGVLSKFSRDQLPKVCFWICSYGSLFYIKRHYLRSSVPVSSIRVSLLLGSLELLVATDNKDNLGQPVFFQTKLASVCALIHLEVLKLRLLPEFEQISRGPCSGIGYNSMMWYR